MTAQSGAERRVSELSAWMVEFMAAERAEGFVPRFRGHPATAGFTGLSVSGRVDPPGVR